MQSETHSKAGGPERSPLAEMILVAAPVVATMTSYTLMQFVDALMVGKIGPDPVYISAQGNGMVWSFVPVSGMMGLLTVINTFVSQNLGAKRADRAPAYAWAGLWMSLLSWFVIMLPFAAVIGLAFQHLTNHDPRLIELETQYARILIGASIITLWSRAIAQYFYGMHKPMVVLVSVVAANLINILANALLIFGPSAPATTGNAMVDGFFELAAAAAAALGIPALGVTGAAWGTVIGTIFEFVLPMAVFLSPAFARRFGTRAAWRPSLAHMRDIARIGWPGAMMFVNEIVCWAYLMSALVGHFGKEHNTAGWIALRYMHLAFMPAIGLSIAVTAQVGKCMGMQRPDLAARRAWLGLALNMAYMILCGVLMVVFREPAIDLFIDPSTPDDARDRLIAIGAQVMIAAAVFQLFDALGITFIGALRGAGDTIWPGVATLVLAWTLLFGLGTWMVHHRPDLGSLGPWIAAAAYIILLGIAVTFRFVSGTWKTIKLVEPPRELAPPAEPGHAPALTAREAAAEALAAAGAVDGVVEAPRE
ncbi:MAG: MATE family efflux transporter [Phycisphaeraceae bacterium]|nr:MATE family efflux transporter [Phycisphaeraceae bacterium]